MFCLLASATCHLFGCLSKAYFYGLMRMDYAGISTLIAASFYPPVRSHTPLFASYTQKSIYKRTNSRINGMLERGRVMQLS